MSAVGRRNEAKGGGRKMVDYMETQLLWQFTYLRVFVCVRYTFSRPEGQKIITIERSALSTVFGSVENSQAHILGPAVGCGRKCVSGTKGFFPLKILDLRC